MGEKFGCCSKFIECSDAKKCVNESEGQDCHYKEFGLFQTDSEYIWSDSLIRRMGKMEEKSKQAREADEMQLNEMKRNEMKRKERQTIDPIEQKNEDPVSQSVSPETYYEKVCKFGVVTGFYHPIKGWLMAYFEDHNIAKDFCNKLNDDLWKKNKNVKNLL